MTQVDMSIGEAKKILAGIEYPYSETVCNTTMVAVLQSVIATADLDKNNSRIVVVSLPDDYAGIMHGLLNGL